MDCEEIKKIIPRYFQHTATEEEIKEVEEHLCVCHGCRTSLAALMDSLSDSGEPLPQENAAEELEAVSPQDSERTPQEDIPVDSQPDKDSASQEEKKGESALPPEEGKIEYFPGEGLESLMSAPVGPDSSSTAEEPPQAIPESSQEEEPAVSADKELSPAESEPAISPNKEIKASEEEKPPVYEEESSSNLLSERDQDTIGEEEPIQEEPEASPTTESEDSKEEIPSLEVKPELEAQLDPALESKPLFSEPEIEEFSDSGSEVSEEAKPGRLEYLALGVGIFILLLFIWLLMRG